MTRHASRPLAVLVLSPRPETGCGLASSLAEDPRFDVKARLGSLEEAYVPTEERQFDVVVCADTLAASPEFAMYNALLEMLRLRLVTVADTADATAVARMLGLPARARPKGSSAIPTGSIDKTSTIVAIGSSTGGIEALSQVLSRYPEDCPPTLIVQHIKPEFLEGVVRRLDRVCPAQVRAADDRQPLRRGQVLFAPGLPHHLEIDVRSRRCKLTDGPPTSGHRPSVDCLMHSLVPIGRNVVGVILTGMGRDGAAGLAALRRAGAWTIAQDAETSTVFGMPRVAQQEGAACQILPIQDIAYAITRAARRTKELQT